MTPQNPSPALDELWEMLTDKHQRLQALRDQLATRAKNDGNASLNTKLSALNDSMSDLAAVLDDCQAEILTLL